MPTVSTSQGLVTVPYRRLEHIHIDIIVMPVSERKRYHIYKSFHAMAWGIPHRRGILRKQRRWLERSSRDRFVDLGHPFELSPTGDTSSSRAFSVSSEVTRTMHLRMASYHPQTNGMVERSSPAEGGNKIPQERSLDPSAADGCWAFIRPGRKICKWWQLRLWRGAPIIGAVPRLTIDGCFRRRRQLRQKLRRRLNGLCSVERTRHGKRNPFKKLATSGQIFVRHDGSKRMLRPSYNYLFSS